ncbi:uncharacterized protein B0I36DRAFT_366951 [Microdochium trichocladiopsis]|uniref:Uncharacterized protein n=1 Tax=Microdochium trichocladiopsis TaxID=1682393 RepID=A0A9P8XYV3_9PEZI|nr:uncharacterized protein B0I36DRAFT_366951 [Microdochium trichocladiopsis]KAH7025055.1 hypothetical protein B0I36DRAFT_366951 [Microdochium trichocladiopsis]
MSRARATTVANPTTAAAAAAAPSAIDHSAHHDIHAHNHSSGPSGPGPAGPGAIIGELVRRASVSIMNTNPQLGMWQATGTAIAQAPNLAELRGTESGGLNIEFNSQGHSARIVAEEDDGELVLVRSNTNLSMAAAGRRGSLMGGGGGLTRRDTGTGTVLAEVREDEDGDHQGKPPTSRPASSSGRTGNGLEAVTTVPDSGRDDRKGRRHGHRFRGLKRRQTLKDKHKHERLEKWGPTVRNGLLAFWKFFTTFAGFCITIYGLNIVAWGAMLFFLLLNAAPAMAVPNADDDYSPRKIWLEIDSQILNALFCVTGLGLAPWRFRDLYFFVRATRFRDADAMQRLARQNKGWFRPPRWAVTDGAAANGSGARGDGAAASMGSNTAGQSTTTTTTTAKYSNVPTTDHDRFRDHDDNGGDIELGHGTQRHHDHDEEDEQEELDFEPRLAARSMTFTGQTAPPTALWKLLFTIMMMVMNTGFQVVLCYFMWGYNRFNRPSWATGTFIALGCATGMFSGLMSWWEGRKVKKIEGPEVQIVEKGEV